MSEPVELFVPLEEAGNWIPVPPPPPRPVELGPMEAMFAAREARRQERRELWQERRDDWGEWWREAWRAVWLGRDYGPVQVVAVPEPRKVDLARLAGKYGHLMKGPGQ